VLKASELQRTIDYYSVNFGACLRWRSGNDGGGENAMMQLGDVNIMFSTGSHLGDSPTFSETLYFDVATVEELYESVKNTVAIFWPLEVMESGQREFGVRDCNGYAIAFAEEAKP
jgi:hypothetical protein